MMLFITHQVIIKMVRRLVLAPLVAKAKQKRHRIRLFFRRRGNALSLESSITLATYITKDVVDYYDEVYAEFTRNGKTEKVYPSGKTLTSNSIVYCIFDYTGISPQALGDDVSITFYGVKDGVTYNGNAYKYSATDYIKSTLNKPTSSAKLKTFAG